MPKPPNVCRIFVFGESAAMGEPSEDFSFARNLEKMLAARFPAVQFEVINTAVAAINSHVIYAIGKACAALEPDVFVVYMGNNEVVGPFGASRAFQASVPPSVLVRAIAKLRKQRLYQLVEYTLSGAWRARDIEIVSWSGEDVFLENQVPADNPQLRRVYANFRNNLDDLCAVAARSGARVVLSTVAVNLRDCGPFASMHGPGFDGAKLEQWQQLYDEGNRFELDGALDRAASTYEAALELDADFAELHFRLARLYLAMDRKEDARKHFNLALELDTVRLRADSTINAIIRETARQHAEEGLKFVDAEAEFARVSPDALPGSELFYEHVHMTLTGYYLLARTIFPALLEALPPWVTTNATNSVRPLEQDECMQRLGLTPIDLLGHIDSISTIMGREIFAHRPYHNEAVRALRDYRTGLERQLDARSMREAAETLRNVLDSWGDDIRIRLRYAEALMRLGDVSGAVRELSTLAGAQPYRGDYHATLAQALLGVGALDEAYAQVTQALALPVQHPPYQTLGLIQAARGRKDDALDALWRAMIAKPTGAAQILPDYARMQAELGQVDDAIESWTRLIETGTDQLQAFNELDRLLSKNGEHRNRADFWRRLAGENPENAPLHFYAGRVLESTDRLSDAVAEYRKALTINPRVLLLDSAQIIGQVPDQMLENVVLDYAAGLPVEPGKALCHLNSGFVLAQLGNAGAALDACRKAILSRPDFHVAYAEFDALLRGGDAQRRVKEWRHIAELLSGTAMPHFYLGTALENIGDTDGAQRAFARAKSLDPSAQPPEQGGAS